MDLVLDFNYFYFANPNSTHLPKQQTVSPNHQFSQRIWYVEYYYVRAHMTWCQKFRLNRELVEQNSDALRRVKADEYTDFFGYFNAPTGNDAGCGRAWLINMVML